jgi:hypothetical protein
LVRTVMQSEETDQYYDVHYEVTKLGPGLPHAAFGSAIIGPGGTAIPILRTPTTPGNLLLVMVVGQGNVGYPSTPRFEDNPNLAVPPVPPNAGLAGWTVVASSFTDYSSMLLGGCGGGHFWPYIPGTCGYGLIASIAYRFVQPAEVTTTPVSVSTDIAGSASAWLWEIPTTSPPTGAFVTHDAHQLTATPATSLLPTLAGNVVGIIAWACSAGHGAIINPDTATTTTGTTVQQSLFADNNPALPAPANVDNFAQVFQLPAGGTAATSVNFNANYSSVDGYGNGGVNYCAVAVELPAGVVLDAIPYPANQT